VKKAKRRERDRPLFRPISGLRLASGGCSSFKPNGFSQEKEPMQSGTGHAAGGGELTIDLPKPKVSWLSRVASGLVIALVIYLSLQFLQIRLTNRLAYDWWRTNDGATYSKYFSLTLTYSLYEGSSLLYGLLSLFLPATNRLNQAAVAFLTGNLLSHMRLPRQPDATDKTTQMGILTPKQLCQTILLHKGDGDESFNAWLKDHPSRMQGEVGPLDANFELTFPAQPDELTKDYTGKAQSFVIKGLHYYGVYPRAGDYESWKGCLQAWANGGLDKQKVNYVWRQSAQNKSIYVLVPNDGVIIDKDAAAAWYDQPDNVFGRYGINMKSPLITFYTTGKAFLDGVPGNLVDGPALENLIGLNFSPSDAGGWLGFINGRGSHAGVDEYYNELYKSVDFSPALPKPECNPTKAAALGSLSGLFTGVAGSAIIFAENPLLGLFAVGFAVAGAAFDAYTKASARCS